MTNQGVGGVSQIFEPFLFRNWPGTERFNIG
jgi:hypothetical protein